MILTRPARTVRPQILAPRSIITSSHPSIPLVRNPRLLYAIPPNSSSTSTGSIRSRRDGLRQNGLVWRGLATGQTGLKHKEEEEVSDLPESPPTVSSERRIPGEAGDVKTTQAGPETQTKVETSTQTTTPTDPPLNPDGSRMLIRPIIPASQVPFLAPSPLNLSVPPYPPIATSVIREAIADFLSAEKSGHVLPVPQTMYDKKSYFGWRVFYWRTKQLFKFYWAGCKCLKANYSLMRTLQKGVRRQGWELTRREKRFVSRTKADLWKIVPFVFFLMTLEEILPLMVLYTPWLLPSTTILPSQFLRIKSAEEIKKREALLEVGKEVGRIRAMAAEPSEAGGGAGGLPILAGLSPELVKGLCKALDLGTVAPMFWLQRRLTRRISDIVNDDNDLRSSLPEEELAVEEKRLILGERGLLVLRTPLEELDAKLDQWLDITRNLTEEESKDRVLDTMLNTASTLREKVVEVDTSETIKAEEK